MFLAAVGCMRQWHALGMLWESWFNKHRLSTRPCYVDLTSPAWVDSMARMHHSCELQAMNLLVASELQTIFDAVIAVVQGVRVPMLNNAWPGQVWFGLACTVFTLWGVAAVTVVHVCVLHYTVSMICRCA